ncbi:SRPBCC family protein [Mariniphaga sp.]|uniref:SRPBCC family protein n=1 Tax=Mariniphaga sp. TaxID=1954475 RepID=UPI00356A3F02
METSANTILTVFTTINVPVDLVWEYWTKPEHIVNWNHASDEWHTPKAQNDLREGGKFCWRMEAKDGSFGFDFEGTFDEIQPRERILYTLADGRKVTVAFETSGSSTTVTEIFEAEKENPAKLQQDGWQAILNNFKKYAESIKKMVRLHFETEIDAPIEKVFRLMLADKTYREWTKLFNPTSRYEGSWEKGSKILFLGTDEKGNEGGMLSRIKDNIPNRFISIEHYGIIADGKEITTGPDVEKWAGGLENYTFENKNGKTLLSVDTDTTPEYKNYFEKTWPKALKKIKEICEA